MATVRAATDEAIADAAARLRRSEPVAFPTETVYGLGAGTRDETALHAVYALKGRPSDNPLIAHVAGPRDAARLVDGWDDRCDALATAFWPGPLTLIRPRSEDVPAVATGGRPTIAVRQPDHPVAVALLAAYGAPISAPSANRSGYVSPTRAAHVADEFADDDVLVLDGGPCTIGLESTVLALVGNRARILRPGSIDAEALADVLGMEVTTPQLRGQAASPGTRSRHYAPQSPIRVVRATEVAAVLADGIASIVLVPSPDPGAEPGADPGAAPTSQAVLAIDGPHEVEHLPGEPAALARVLYDAVRAADARIAQGSAIPSRLVIVRPTEIGGPWSAIHDRLDRMGADDGDVRNAADDGGSGP